MPRVNRKRKAKKDWKKILGDDHVLGLVRMRVSGGCFDIYRTGAISFVSQIDAIVEIIASHGRFDAAGKIASELVWPARAQTVARVV